MYFKDFDFENFWYTDNPCEDRYICPTPSDDIIAKVEYELGYKLPDSYIRFMKAHNGGIPVKNCFPTDVPTGWAEDHVAVSDFMGIGFDGENSLCGKFGSRFWIEEWEYPDIGVAICNCPSAGHDMIFLDYRNCGISGQPCVVHIDQEADYEITFLAPSFEEFIYGLIGEENFDY